MLCSLCCHVGQYADVTFIGQAPQEGLVSSFNVWPKSRWYAKGCTFRQCSGRISPFQVTKGGALALDSSAVLDTMDNLSNKGCGLGRCTYNDSSPVKGRAYLFACFGTFQCRLHQERCSRADDSLSSPLSCQLFISKLALTTLCYPCWHSQLQ
jgi:hypothetical protein